MQYPNLNKNKKKMKGNRGCFHPQPLIRTLVTSNIKSNGTQQ